MTLDLISSPLHHTPHPHPHSPPPLHAIFNFRISSSSRESLSPLPLPTLSHFLHHQPSPTSLTPPASLLHLGEPGRRPAGCLLLELMEFLVPPRWVVFIIASSLGFNLLEGFASPNLRGTGQHFSFSCRLSTSFTREKELATTGSFTTSQEEVGPGVGALVFGSAQVLVIQLLVRAGEST